MKKGFVILFLVILLVGFVVGAGNVEKDETIEVLIENKHIEKNSISIFSMKKTEKPKYEIKNISKAEFELLKKDDSILIQEKIPKQILLDVSVPLIEADTVWSIQQNTTNITGEGQTVCILDTGAQTNHPALISKNATCNLDCLTNPNTCTEDCSKTDTDGHGTHVAGIIASSNTTYRGVTINAKYIPLMVCDTISCDDISIQTAMDWCISNKDVYNISVISMSLGTETTYPTECDASYSIDAAKINLATQNNISVVVATGNGANLTGISEPACIGNSIKVGNIYSSNEGGISWGSPITCSDATTFADKIVCHTNRNSFFSDMLLAPGAMIISTWNNSGYEEAGGTSMSAPHVAGIIALINHYKKLESNKTYTPSEIESILIESGEPINDTAGTNIIYSRVDGYQAILYSDEQSPNITSMIPPNNSLLDSVNTNFTCNATDNLQFVNLTIKIYNSTSLVHNMSTTNESLTTNYTLIQGDYNWSCIAVDNQSNSQTKTFFITVSPIQNSVTPTNNTYTNQKETSFNCSTESTTQLSNITFYLYENNSLIYNSTENLTGLSNYSLFTYNLTNETSFLYSCLAINNDSETSQTENHTITYDITSPQITLLSPTGGSTTTKTHTFAYSTTENETIDFCNLTINGEIKSSFTQTLEDGTYTWFVNCTDFANNTNSSSSRTLTIYTAPSSGGGSSSSPRTYTIKDEQIQQGIEQKLKTKDIIKFKSKSQDHKLTLNKINTNKVNITIESTPINAILYLNAPQKINLDNDKTFDLEINLISISGSYANIFIKEINEAIPTKHIFEIENETDEQVNETISEKIENSPKNKFMEILNSIFRKIANFLQKLFHLKTIKPSFLR